MNKKMGFTLVEIMIVVAIIGLLAAIAIPSFIKARTNSQTNSCKENLRQIEGAKEQWAMDNGIAQATAINTTGVGSYLKSSRFPSCPANGTYTYGAIGTDAACTITGHANQ